jgi:hypothetical protein
MIGGLLVAAAGVGALVLAVSTANNRNGCLPIAVFFIGIVLLLVAGGMMDVAT